VDENPLEQLVAGYFRRGQRVRELIFDRPFEPTAVVVVLDNGKEYPHAVDTDERGSLPEWLIRAQLFLIMKRDAL
jgi:hypothetical protein